MGGGGSVRGSGRPGQIRATGKGCRYGSGWFMWGGRPVPIGPGEPAGGGGGACAQGYRHVGYRGPEWCAVTAHFHLTKCVVRC